MHPAKFMGRTPQSVKPAMSDEQRAERLQDLGNVLSAKRKEAVDARRTSGIEDAWTAAEEAYVGMDDANRHEFANARWAKPASMSGSPTQSSVSRDATRSNVFVRLTARYVDNAAAKLGEILFPIDDKAFSFEPTPDPDLVKQAEDLRPLVDAGTGAPVMKAPEPTYGAPSPEAMAQQGQQPQQQATMADAAKEKMAKASDAAKLAENRVYDWMTEANYPAEGRKVIHDAARIGVGVLKGPFPDMQENRAVTVNGDTVAIQIERKVVPSLKWVDPWNLFPADGCGENIHDGDYVFERDFLSEKALKKLKNQPGYIASAIDAVIEEGPGKCKTESKNPGEREQKNRYDVWYYYGILKRDELEAAGAIGVEDLPEDAEDAHAIVTMVNDHPIRAALHPLESGTFPYRVVPWSRRAGHWAGVGVGEQMSVPQRIVNASTRALLNNAGAASGVQIVIDQAGIIPADNSYKITPNKVWYKTAEGAPDVRAAFQVFTIPALVADLQRIIEYGMKLAEESTGIPLITQGQTGPTSPETFGQAELQDNNAHTWLRSVGYRYDDCITEPLVTDFYEYLLLDPEVPNEAKGDFRIHAHGSIAMVERAIQEQTLMGMLGAANNPAFDIDPAKLFALYLKAKRLDPREVQLSDERKKARDAQPPAPPIQVQVEQQRGQNKLAEVDAKAKAELTVVAQEAAHEQQLLATGGASPHQANAIANIERERVRAESSERIQESRANAELARAEKEQQIALQNGAMDVRKLELQKELALIELARQQNISLQEAKTELAKVSMQETTKRELAAAEIQLAAGEGDANRAVDLHKHHNPAPSLVRDEISTDATP